MPIYEYECPLHGRFSEIASHHEIPMQMKCPECSEVCEKVVSLPAKHTVDFRAGWNAGAGRNFDTKQERTNWLEESGSRKVSV